MKIVFFGTPEFAVASLDRLVKSGAEIAAVVTMPDKRAGRGHHMIESDVKKYAVAHNLRLLQPEKLKAEDFLNELRAINADLFIVIAFRMLPKEVWMMPKYGTFNLHASLLPRYRGAAPINWAVINGDTETGVTTFFLKHEIDTGDIIEQRKVPVYPEDNVGDVHDRLMEVGAEMVASTVESIQSGTMHVVAQPEGDFLPAPKIFKETCRIDWNKRGVEVHNLVRGLSPYPAAWTVMDDSKHPEGGLDIKVFATALTEISSGGRNPGDVVVERDKLLVAASDYMLEVLSVQPAGKKRMDADAFLRGYSPKVFKSK